ncbi:MAG: hypothetical protein KIPDCIKN_01159 [Haliscomenobacter sp.]|nr:hypothetical protein [Haliscomenobacter sp.]
MEKKNYDITREEFRTWLSENRDSLPDTDDVAGAEEALLAFASAHRIDPPDDLRNKILGNISQLNEQKRQRRPFHSGQLPPLDENPNLLDWSEAVAGINPPEQLDNIYLHTLESDDQRELFVAWVRELVEEEVHHDLLESFLILEGACECHITDPQGVTRLVRMRPGDFITMQLGETHNILVTSAEPVKAILQWKKLAAA